MNVRYQAHPEILWALCFIYWISGFPSPRITDTHPCFKHLFQASRFFICAPKVYIHAVVVRHKNTAVCSKNLSVLIALNFMSGLWGYQAIPLACKSVLRAGDHRAHAFPAHSLLRTNTCAIIELPAWQLVASERPF
jgi:hypothetical protein